MFCFYYKIIGLSLKKLAAGLPIFGQRVWAGPGPKMCGLNSSLRVWARQIFAGLGQACILTANCGPGLGLNYRPVQGTNT